MVQIIYTRESSNCDISKKNIIRRSSDFDTYTMGNNEGHHSHASSLTSLHSSSTQHVEKESINGAQTIDNKKNEIVIKYEPLDILALKDAPLSKKKPLCADLKSFWTDGLPYGECNNYVY